MTVTPRPLLRALDARDGHRCAWHKDDEKEQCDPETLVPQHRGNRGMGGFKSANRLSNLVWLDSAKNLEAESDPVVAAEARRRGIKISRYDNPEHTPIEHAVHGRALLLDDGSVVTGLAVI